MGDHPGSDPSNAGQLDHWDGDGGAFWATHADHFDAGVAGYRDTFLAAAAVGEHETVLDIGCGNGRTTLDAAVRAPAGSALGVDLSAVMLAVARQRAERERVPNASFEQLDAQVHPFPPAAFDLAISRNGAMFFADPVAAFANIGRALRPGGRLVLQAWQSWERNESLRTFLTVLSGGGAVAVPPADGPSPFGLSDPDRVRSVLTAAGYRAVHLQAVSAPMWVGADPDDAFRFVTAQHAARVRELDPAARTSALDALRASLSEHHTERGVHYDSAAWIIQAGWP